MTIDELQKYINALRKCAKEHDNDTTYTGHIIVSNLCRDTANLLETINPYELPDMDEDSVKRDMKRVEHDKIINLMKHGSLQGIDTGRLDGKCEDVIPLEDAIAIVDLVYNAESEET